MSIQEARSAIVAALGTIPNIDVHAYTPENIAWNSVWVSWQETEILNDCQREHEFVVIYVPPQSTYEDTFSRIDEMTPVIYNALFGVGPVTTIQPQVFQMGQPGVSQIWGAEFTVEVTVRTGE